MIFIILQDSKKKNFCDDVENYNRINHKMKQTTNWKCIEIKEDYNDEKSGQEIWRKKIEKEARKSSNFSIMI